MPKARKVVVKKKKDVKSKKSKVKPINQGVKISAQPRNPQKVASNSSTTMRGVCSRLCSITDPFCSQAKNAKWPDGLGGQTLTMQTRRHIIMPTFAGGGNVAYFGGSLPYAALFATSYTAPNFTLNSTQHNVTLGSNFSTYAAQYRIVTSGIIIRNMLPALTAAGYVMVSRLTVFPAVGSAVTEGLVEGTDIQTFPITSGMELALALKPVGMMSRSFNNENTTTTTISGWDVIKVEIVGGPASIANAIDIEIVNNVEFTIELAQTGLHALVTTTAPHAPHLTTASSRLMDVVGHFAVQGVEKLSAIFMTKATEALASLAVM